MDTKDIVVIGGGPGGYVAAIRAARLGAKVTLVEKSTPGGTCVTSGCIPVKALVRAAELIELGKAAKDYGINYQEPVVDFARMMTRKDTIVKTVSSGVKLLLEGNGVEVVNGSARFLSPNELEIKLADSGVLSVAARRIIIATGSRCHVPEDLKTSAAKVLTTDEALSLNHIPASMVILGGGFVGLAFATIFSRLGTRVALVEKSIRLLPELDAEIVSVLEKELKKSKVQVFLGAQLFSQSGKVSITVSEKAEPVDVDADIILVAEERRPNIEDLGLDKAGVALNGKGGIRVDDRMATSVPGVFAVGDVTMGRMFTHVAYAEGIVAAENAMGKGSRVDYTVVPLCANTLPEVAGFGLSEQRAKDQGYDVKVGKFPFAANGAATVLGQRTGLIKMISDKKYGQILGAHIVGPQASILISEIALAAKLEATPADIASLMHFHPSLTEASWEVARDSIGQAIHMISEAK